MASEIPLRVGGGRRGRGGGAGKRFVKAFVGGAVFALLHLVTHTVVRVGRGDWSFAAHEIFGPTLEDGNVVACIEGADWIFRIESAYDDWAIAVSIPSGARIGMLRTDLPIFSHAVDGRGVTFDKVFLSMANARISLNAIVAQVVSARMFNALIV